jgi:hypothetical protein
MKKYILLILISLVLITPAYAADKTRRVEVPLTVHYVYTAAATYIQWFNVRPAIRYVYTVRYLCIEQHCTTRYNLIWSKPVGFQYVSVADRTKNNNYVVR